MWTSQGTWSSRMACVRNKKGGKCTQEKWSAEYLLNVLANQSSSTVFCRFFPTLEIEGELLEARHHTFVFKFCCKLPTICVVIL